MYLNFTYHTQQAHHLGDERHIVFAPPFHPLCGDQPPRTIKIKLIQLHATRLGRANRRVQQHERGLPNGVMASLTMLFSGGFAVIFAPLVARLF